MRNATWLNTDGMQVGFGARDSITSRAGRIETTGNRVQHSILIDYRDMPTTDNVRWYNSTLSKPITKSIPIPANAVIVEAKLNILTTFTCAGGNPTMTIGLMKTDGTVIDADGLYAGLTEASGQLTAGVIVDGDAATYGGALVNGTASIGADAGHIYCAGVTMLTAATAFEAGSAILTVDYILTIPDYDPTSPYATTTKLT